MKLLLSVGLATVYGLFIRLFFGAMNDYMGVMSFAFLAIAPMVIGFLTVLFLPRNKITSNASAFFTPWLTCLAVFAITMLFNIEGLICWAMVFPFFAILAGIGGLISFKIKKKKSKKDDEEYKELLKNLNKPQISLILFIPVILGFIEGERTLTRKDYHLTESVIIDASKEEVWQHITQVCDIKVEEAGNSLSDIIGFPRHTNTITSALEVNGTRKAIYEKGLFFDEVIEEIIPNEKLRLKVITQPDKVPPTVMDEHIVIGGKFVDILEDEYQIKELSPNRCEVTLKSHFFINTHFNWYAGIWSEYLMRDILSKELDRIASRSEVKE